MGVGPKINHTTFKGIMHTAQMYTELIYNINQCCAEKPNHNLMYSIGSDFCIEDPMNTPFLVTIMCRLENEPQPPPEFHWSILYNNTKVDLSGLSSLQVFNESDALYLSGTLELGESVSQSDSLTITCTVDNLYDNDTENTLISLCGKGEAVYTHVCF